MPKLKYYPVFISHAWDYSADYYRLERMLNKARYFKWGNCSVPRHDSFDTRTDAELEEALKNQISSAKVVVIISGMYVKHHKWIQKEIDIALEMHKPIMALKPRGSQKMPLEIEAIDPDPKGWSTSTVVNSIRSAKRPSERAISIETAQDDKGKIAPDITKTADKFCSFSELSSMLSSNDSGVAALIARRAKSVARRKGMSG